MAGWLAGGKSMQNIFWSLKNCRIRLAIIWKYILQWSVVFFELANPLALFWLFSFLTLHKKLWTLAEFELEMLELSASSLTTRQEHES